MNDVGAGEGLEHIGRDRIATGARKRKAGDIDSAPAFAFAKNPFCRIVENSVERRHPDLVACFGLADRKLLDVILHPPDARVKLPNQMNDLQ